MGQTKQQILSRSRNDWYLTKLSNIRDCDGISNIILRNGVDGLFITETDCWRVIIKDPKCIIPKCMHEFSIYSGTGFCIDTTSIVQRWEADFCIRHLIFTGYGWINDDPEIQEIYIEKAW